MKHPMVLQRQIKRLLLLFIIALAVSGITAFFVETELQYLLQFFGFGTTMNFWLQHVHDAIAYINSNYPFISYGFDWLGFGHLIIALFFIEVLRHPIENNWVIRYGMLACLAVLPTAFIAGSLRRIPLLWQLIDCAFGVFGFILLFIIDRKIFHLKTLLKNE